MINFHPNSEMLEQYAAGTLAPAEALLVSAHCDMCSQCQQQVMRLTNELARSAFDVSDNSIPDDFDAMLASIIAQPQEQTTNFPVTANDTSNKRASKIVLDGKSFEVPRTLQRFIQKKGNWSSLVGNLWQAPVDIGYDGAANFIYMEKGGSVPEHTHRGNEITLVINGEFSDGMNHYDSGDFIMLNGTHTHAPKSDAQEGCLVFSIVDQPLHFTSGIARLLNPFSHLFFR